MADNATFRSPFSRAGDKTRGRPWLLAVPGLLCFHLSLLLWGNETGLWLAPVGLGIALVAWLGFWVVVPLFADLLLVRIGSGNADWSHAFVDSFLLAAQIGLSWWCYSMCQGARRLDDPRSAVIFLILIPAILTSLFSLIQAFLLNGYDSDDNFWMMAGSLWLARALGILVLVPPLLSALTPVWVELRLTRPEPKGRHPGDALPLDWTWGETIEVAGLCLATGILGLVLAYLHARRGVTVWQLWGLSLLIIVWAGLRQGLRGGALAAGTGAFCALALASFLGGSAANLNPLQGNLLAQCSAALLVGASAGWVQASEARYRRVIGHIPVVLYSARVPRWVPARISTVKPLPHIHGKAESASGSALIDHAEITLVSPASRQILGCAPDDLLGPFRALLDRIFPADRELVTAALGQLCLQNQPVTCEFRLSLEKETPLVDNANPELSNLSGTAQRWVRNTLAPHYGPDGHLDGWEGVVEDITEQRALAHDLRRTTGMLHALVAHLPTGIFFVQGPLGLPILVNSRARQLLGQREDLAAGLSHLSSVYRLHRPDGSEYPWEELPVARALRLGTSSMADDIVVHRADGRRVPLVSWGAPVDLVGTGNPDAAVWVMEDLSAVKHAEAARRESESRLRAVFDTMAEGAVVHNQAGQVIECNQAACSILRRPAEHILGLPFLSGGCFREDGSNLPNDELPDQRVVQTGKPVRDVVIGLPEGEAKAPVRWVLANAMPLPPGTTGLLAKEGRVVTTFADITAQRQALDVVHSAKEKYQELVECLPLMVLQFNPEGQITFLNSATQQILGLSAPELITPGFWRDRIHAEDLPQFQTALERTLKGYVTRVEFRIRARDAEKVGYALLQPQFHDDTVIGSTCLIVDMTLQRRLEQELQRAQRLELVGRLASGTVHDFNNLLTVMMGMAALAQSGLPENHASAHELQRILEVGEQATHLAGQLLTFSRQRRVQPQSLDVNTVVVHTLKLIRGIIPPNVTVETELAPSEPRLLGDETQLRQVVMNLILNARDAMPDGGKLRLQTEMVPAGAPAFPSADAGTRFQKVGLRLIVEDTGTGMSAQVLEHIFDPFFSTKERGTGLGLAVVQQIVHSHGGQIAVHSQPAQGARFEIWLPALSKTAALPAEAVQVR